MSDERPTSLPVPATTVEPTRSPTALPPEVQDAAAEKRREREEREQAAQDDAEAALAEARAVRIIDADTEARRGQAIGAAVRGGCVVGGFTLVGTFVGGPIGGVVGGAVGWVADTLIGRW